MPTLEHHRGEAGALQVGGQAQAVVARADHDCVVRPSHVPAPPATASVATLGPPTGAPRRRGVPKSAVALPTCARPAGRCGAASTATVAAGTAGTAGTILSGFATSGSSTSGSPVSAPG